MRLFDLHCDTVMLGEQTGADLYSNELHIDLKRGLALYDTWVQVMALYVPDTATPDDAWRQIERMLRYLAKQEQQHKSFLQVLWNRRLPQHIPSDGSRCVVLPAIENGAAIGTDLQKLTDLSKHGVVYMNLTWNGSNAIGNGCMSAQTTGLTPFGKQVVEELYRLHILPDVSHLNEAGFWDVVSLSNGRPFLAGHSVSKTVWDHPRSLSDAQFDAVKQSGGLVGLNVCIDQLGAPTFEQFERHLYHFLSRGGENTLALGLDLDGTELPQDWGGIALPAKLYEYLLMRQYSSVLLDKIFFENSYHFFEKTLTSEEECIRIGT